MLADNVAMADEPPPDVAWTSQFDAGGLGSTAATVDANGAVYLIGQTTGALPGLTDDGWSDARVRKRRHPRQRAMNPP